MADKNPRKNPTTDALFDAILSLETREECYNFFEDLCTVKEISDMAQRLEAAKLLLNGSTYDQIVKAVEISTATISRINRCIQYGSSATAIPLKKCRRPQSRSDIRAGLYIGWTVPYPYERKEGPSYG